MFNSILLWKFANKVSCRRSLLTWICRCCCITLTNEIPQSLYCMFLINRQSNWRIKIQGFNCYIVWWWCIFKRIEKTDTNHSFITMSSLPPTFSLWPCLNTTVSFSLSNISAIVVKDIKHTKLTQVSCSKVSIRGNSVVPPAPAPARVWAADRGWQYD